MAPDVAVVKNKDADRAVKSAMRICKAKFSGKVFIKPNIAHNRPSPITTSAKVVKAVVENAFEMGADEVLVGDSPSYPTKYSMRRSVEQVYDGSGIAEAAESAGAKMYFVDREKFASVEIEGLINWKPKIAKIALEADYLINLPVMKTHHMTTVTLGIKNLHGLVQDQQKILFHSDAIHAKLVDVLRAARPSLTIVDATTAMEGNGPSQGSPVKLDTIVASKDTVACDAVCCAIMGVDWKTVEHIKVAAGCGLGVADLRKIRVLGTALRTYRRTFKLPDLSIDYDGVNVYKGGACTPCIALLKTALHSLHTRNPEMMRDINIYIGINPPPARKKNLTFIVGDCACKSFGGEGIRIKGCPPFDVVVKIREALKSNLRR